MNFNEKIEVVKNHLLTEGSDGWLLYDFRKSNALAYHFLEIPESVMLTRRFFYWIPTTGEPVKLVSQIEPHVLDHLPGQLVTFKTWSELKNCLQELLKGKTRIAMEYSPDNSVPTLSKVDAGTVELVRHCGVDVYSSGDLLQQFTSVWSEEQFKLHREAAMVLEEAVTQSWGLIRESLVRKRPVTEWEVQQFILNHLHAQGCITSAPPICAVNAHAADPHYMPRENPPTYIQEGDIVLIDLWCKCDRFSAVYADITRMGVAAAKPSEKFQQVFDCLVQAQQAAFDFITECALVHRLPKGWEVDQVCRGVVEKNGFGDYFIHRTGHNIGEEDHGDGANIDNYETKEMRHLIPGTCFSIEPGIYLPGEFGVRLEYNVYIPLEGLPRITTGVQTQPVLLF